MAEVSAVVAELARSLREDIDPVLPAGVSGALRRVGQEAVFNAELHSNGTSCTVTLESAADQWSLTIRDDGSGFGPKLPEAGHFGLQLVREAAHDAGGTVEIHGDQDGVQVECTIPVEA